MINAQTIAKWFEIAYLNTKYNMREHQVDHPPVLDSGGFMFKCLAQINTKIKILTPDAHINVTLKTLWLKIHIVTSVQMTIL